MSEKGHVFTEADIPARRLARMDKSQVADWCRSQTERHRIVALDRGEKPSRQPIIAEELTQRTINRLKSPKARRAVTALLRMPEGDRLEVLAAFKPDGSLKNPFSAPK